MMKKIILLLTFFCVSLLANAQSTINITTSGGDFHDEKWVDITTAVNGGGVQVWGQGNGTYGDSAGLINQDISLTPGTYYVNCYDRYADTWDDTLISITAYGVVLSDNGGVTPDDGTDDDLSSDFGDTQAQELEASLMIVVPNAPSCLVPVNLAVSNISGTAADLSWAQGGTETAWEYALLLATDPAPTNGTSTTATTFNATGLTDGVDYVFYLRADCTAGDYSTWISIPFTAYTPVAGDTCDIALPINCGDNVSGTTVGATSNSAPTGACGSANTGGPGLWYSFTGNGDIITASLCGSAFDTQIQVYEGSCAALICVDGNDDSCGLQSEIEFVSTAGTPYFIYVYGYDNSEIGSFTLDFSCRTIYNPITTDITTYTVDELISPILVDVDCASVSGTTFSSHSTGADIGISYFTDGGGNFPFEDGIVLSSGRATDAEGPYASVGPSGEFYSPGDTDLENILGMGAGSTYDASYIEFDFVPIGPDISFNFILASSEYNHDFECTYGDAFAFILTHIPSGTITNLAVLPTTDTATNAVAVTNIHPDVPFYCGPANEQYFDSYSLSYDVIGYSGRTVPLTAQSVVVPGDSYHIKLVVADAVDEFWDTAVFIEGGSFSLGTIDLGNDVFLGDPAALCEGDVTTLNAGLLPVGSFITWYKDGVEVTGTTNGAGEEVLDIDQTGDYTVEFTINGTDCSADGSVHIEFYPKPNPDLGIDKRMCANEPFELAANVTNAINALSYTWEYNGVVIPGATSSTYTVLETIVEPSNGNASGVVQFENPIDGTITYVDLLNGAYNLGDFTVTVTDNVTGCIGTDTIHIDYYENANCIDFPTGISPNGDGINDCIVLDDLEDLVGISRMQIFNRYGTKVYEKSQYEREWCGTNDDGDLLPTGTYYYILNYENGAEPLKSWIYINREK